LPNDYSASGDEKPCQPALFDLPRELFQIITDKFIMYASLSAARYLKKTAKNKRVFDSFIAGEMRYKMY